MLQPIDGTALLDLWERGLSLPAGAADGARADALLAAASDAPPATLGERNRRLIAIHCDLFGRELALMSRCPACDEAVEFEVDAAAVAPRLQSADGDAPHRLEWNGHAIAFRLPNAGDIAEAGAGSSDDGDFARRVLRRCVLSAHAGGDVAFDALPSAALDAISARMEQIDPGASLAFAVECPGCSTAWSAPLDLAQLVWRKVRAAAEALLLDIDALARAYGWSEREVLGLTPLRRAAYLQLVAA
jgi:hypothetical protein